LTTDELTRSEMCSLLNVLLVPRRPTLLLTSLELLDREVVND
jgi:hypothetical protein